MSAKMHEFKHGPLTVVINPEAANELSPRQPGNLPEIVGTFIDEHAARWLSRLENSRLFAKPTFIIKSVYADQRSTPPKLIRLIGEFTFDHDGKPQSRPFMISPEGAGMMPFLLVRGNKGLQIYCVMRPVLRAGTGGIEIGIAGGSARREGESKREWAQRNLDETVGKDRLKIGKRKHAIVKLNAQLAADGSWTPETLVWSNLVAVGKGKNLKSFIRSGDFLLMNKSKKVRKHIQSQKVEEGVLKGGKLAGLIVEQKSARQVCRSMEASWPIAETVERIHEADKEVARRGMRKGLKRVFRNKKERRRVKSVFRDLQIA